MLEKLVKISKFVGASLVLSYNLGCVPSKYYRDHKIEVNPCFYQEQVYDKQSERCEFIFDEIPNSINFND